MGFETASQEFQQQARYGKLLMARYTLNKRAEAASLGVSHTTVGRWCDVNDINQHMPWFCLGRHSAVVELSKIMLGEAGYSLVPLIEPGELNGDVKDERDRILVELGASTKKIIAAENDARTPGRISVGEALDMLPEIRRLIRLAVRWEAELLTITGGIGEEARR